MSTLHLHLYCLHIYPSFIYIKLCSSSVLTSHQPYVIFFFFLSVVISGRSATSSRCKHEHRTPKQMKQPLGCLNLLLPTLRLPIDVQYYIIKFCLPPKANSCLNKWHYTTGMITSAAKSLSTICWRSKDCQTSISVNNSQDAMAGFVTTVTCIRPHHLIRNDLIHMEIATRA